jgi:hypothetical protein
MLVSFACLAAMTTPAHLRLISDRYDRTIVLRALALPNLAAYTLTVWVRCGGFPPNPRYAAAADSVCGTLRPHVQRACNLAPPFTP